MQRIPRAMAMACEADHRTEPVIKVAQGERFVLETEDCSGGYFTDESVLPIPENRPTHRFDPPRVNPCAGPVYIEGAQKGDIVAVTIQDILPDDRSFTILRPGAGLLGDSRSYSDAVDYVTRIFNHEPGPSGTLRDGTCVFNDRVRFPLRPFVGTLCLAPEREVLATNNLQGPWGGNLDIRDFAPGSVVYLASHVEGGLLYAGDVHACQGDGEVTTTAFEMRAEVTLSCAVIKEDKQSGIRIKKSDALVGVGIEKPLEAAVRSAFTNLLDWVVSEYGFSQREAYLLISGCPDTRINVYQMIDIPEMFYVAGVEIPLRYLA